MHNTTDTHSLKVMLFVTLSCLTDPQFYRMLGCKIQNRIRAEKTIPADEEMSMPGRALPDIPVDLVYTWVDVAKKVQAQSEEAAKAGYSKAGYTPARFADHGELRLSLRSVEKFLPWVRMIFIVTDGQVPKWLNLDHPKIKMITHNDIFPEENVVPTFNSHAIEFQLHRIPNLSEHFIYCNDDTFFGQPCAKEDFFSVPDGQGDDGAIKLNMWFAGMILPAFLCRHPNKRLWERAWNNLKYHLELRHFPRKVRYKFLHQATPMKKAFLQKAADDFPDLYAQVTAARFRTAQDIPPIGLANHLAFFSGAVVLRPITAKMFTRMDMLRQCAAAGRMPKLCCLNILHEQVADIAFCEERSSFEKTDSI